MSPGPRAVTGVMVYDSSNTCFDLLLYDPMLNMSHRFNICFNINVTCCETIIAGKGKEPENNFFSEETSKEESLSLRPNPAHQFTYIDYSFQQSRVDIVVLNMYQAEVKRFNGVPGTGSILLNTEELPAGMYLIYAINGNQKLKAKKLIVIKE
jgi:hypothetical protein